MKIDEAINILKQYIDYNNPDIPDFYTMEEACEVVIKALEQQPCDDCISREKALQIIRAWFDREATPSDLKNEIEQLPPVTPQPKMGHCKDCKYFEYDSVAKVNGIPLIIAHEICKRWGDGCKSKEDGYCFLFEPKTQEVEE